MSKTQVAYIVMILVFSLGLWAILRAGSRLHAAPDVAGEWAVAWDGAGEKAPERLTVSQSGRFISGTLAGADRDGPVKLRGTLERIGPDRTDVTMRAVNDPLTLSATYDRSTQTFSGKAGGAGRWHAVRVPKASSR